MSPGPQASAGDPGARQDGTLRAAILSVAATAAVLSGAALAVSGAQSAFGVAIGGGLATANLMVFARIGDAFLSRKGRTAPWAVIATLKLVVLFGGIWLIVRSGVASGLTLGLGYTALPIGITVGSLLGPKPRDTELVDTHPNPSGATGTEPGSHASTGADSDADVLEAGRREPPHTPAGPD